MEDPVLQVEAEVVGVVPFMPLAVGAPEKVIEGVTVGVDVAQEVPLLAADALAVEVGMLVDVALTVPVTASQGVAEPVEVNESVTTRVTVEEAVMLLMLEEADTVAETLTVAPVTLGQEDGEASGVKLPEPLPPGEAVPVVVCDRVPLGLSEEPMVMEPVGEVLETLLSEARVVALEEGVARDVPLAVALLVAATVTDTLPVMLVVGDWLPVALPLPVALEETVTVGVKVGVAVVEAVPVAPAAGEPVRTGVELRVPCARLADTVLEPVAETLKVMAATEAVAPVGEAVAGNTERVPLKVPSSGVEVCDMEADVVEVAEVVLLAVVLMARE